MSDTKPGPPDLMSGEHEEFLEDIAAQAREESLNQVREGRKTIAPPPLPEDVDLEKSEYFDQAVLGGGMPVYSRREPGNRFECRIVARAGHRYDPMHQPGLIRTMTHCMMTGNHGLDFRNEKQLQEYLDANFFELKPPLVATYDTVWSGACRKRDAEKLVRFMHTLVTKPKFDNIELGRSKTAEECHESPRDAHARIVNKLITQALYGNHQLASAWGIPDKDELASITEDDIHSCHKQHYGQRNMALMISGDVVFSDFLADIFDEFNVKGESHGPPERLHAIEPGKSILAMMNFKTERGKTSSGFAQLTFTWVTRRGKRYQAFLVKTILEKLLRNQFKTSLKIPPKSLEVRSYVSPECETFTVEVTAANQTLPEVQSVMIGVIQNASAILQELDVTKRKLGAHLDMMAHSITTRLDDAVRDWSERGTITSPEEHAKIYEETTTEVVKDFLTVDLSMNECLIVTVDQSS